ncbi:MAG: S46 family peptidase [Ignavibacteria bacterium]|nr:S46 family peptidase [Ignavibacteria bacterium]
MQTKNKLEQMKEDNFKLRKKDELYNQLLGEALYSVHGDVIPPDATFTLQLADAVVKSYNYDGIRAPYKTTFYGSLDRYYSFDKKFPFNLPHYWEDLPENFDFSIPLNFASTKDIVGGNSGSPVININAEIVGLAFDGNIESLPARYIYTSEANRAVSVNAERYD